MTLLFCFLLKWLFKDRKESGQTNNTTTITRRICCSPFVFEGLVVSSLLPLRLSEGLSCAKFPSAKLRVLMSAPRFPAAGCDAQCPPVLISPAGPQTSRPGRMSLIRNDVKLSVMFWLQEKRGSCLRSCVCVEKASLRYKE